MTLIWYTLHCGPCLLCLVWQLTRWQAPAPAVQCVKQSYHLADECDKRCSVLSSHIETPPVQIRRKRVFELDGGFIMKRWRGKQRADAGSRQGQGMPLASSGVGDHAAHCHRRLTAVPRLLGPDVWSCDMCCNLQGSQQRCQAPRLGCLLRLRSPTARQRRRRLQWQKLLQPG